MRKIFLHKRFYERRDALPSHTCKKLLKIVSLLERNPFHPSLGLQDLAGSLRGYWNIVVDAGYSIIFRVFENGDVLFISVGTHAIYN